MNPTSLASAKIRTVARLLRAMDEQAETAGLVAAREILDAQIGIIDAAIEAIEQHKGEIPMETTNEQLSKHFTDGADYLRTWNADKTLREEFGGDFQSYCFFRQAEALGLVKILQGQTKI